MAAPERSWLARVGWLLGEEILPLPLALYANHRYLAGPSPAGANVIPAGDWVISEADALLERSEGRLESLESKGPALVTVCAVVAAAIAVAIPLSWSNTTGFARTILIVAGVYSLISLYTPILLVGPVSRSTVTAATLRRADGHERPTLFLACEKARAAGDNDRSTQRLSNLQAASRNDARNAVFLFALWAVLILTGITKT